MRLDVYLTETGKTKSRSQAAEYIKAGLVSVNGNTSVKASYLVSDDDNVILLGKTHDFVGRGGIKLDHALTYFDIDVTGMTAVDIGASTGGFTDCLLQNGAKFVYAADVGYGQLDWKIRSSNQVKTIEKTNLRTCNFSDIYEKDESVADLLVSDLSFISLEKIVPNLKTLMNKDFHEMICLIKPQFEAGKDLVEKGGVVRDKNVHVQVIQNVINCVKSLNYTIKGITYSSIKGPAGNIEYLIWFTTEQGEDIIPNISELVDTAHEVL